MAYSLDTEFPSGIIYTGDLISPFTVFSPTPGSFKRIKSIHCNNSLTATLITFELRYADDSAVFSLLTIGVSGSSLFGGVRAFLFSAGFRTDRGLIIAGATGGSATIFHDPGAPDPQ